MLFAATACSDRRELVSVEGGNIKVEASQREDGAEEVRAIVGTLMEVGRERMTIDGLRKVIEDKNRCSAGHSVPACGLYFIQAEYPETIYNI